VGRHHQDEADEGAAAGAPIGGGAAGVSSGGDEEDTEQAGCSSSSDIQAQHEAEDQGPATQAGESFEDNGFTEDESSTDEAVVAEAIAQHVGDPGAFAAELRGQESSPGPVRVPITPTGSADGVKVTIQAFKAVIKDLVFFTYRVQFRLTREATEAMLRQRRRELFSATPHKLNKLVRDTVSVHSRRVDACREVCVAFTAKHKSDDKCWICGAARYMSAGKPAKQVEYVSLIAWLTAILADPILGPEMVATMNAARLNAARKDYNHPYADCFHGNNFQELYNGGCFSSDLDFAISLSTDGFEAWRQQGFSAWPVIAMILSLAADRRARNISQLILCVTPGPKQPVLLESFLHHIVVELNQLACGISGVRIAGTEGEHTIRAFLLQVTGDMPAIDKIINAKGHNGRTPDRCRKFQGAQFDNNMYYFPPRHPNTKATLFNIRGNQARRTPTSLATDVRAVEEARAGPSLKSTVEEMEKDCGIKGYSLLCSPSPAHKSLYPHLKYLEKLGSNAAPYDVMHLLFCNVVPFLWDLFLGARRVPGIGQDDFVMSAADSDAAGRELRAARPTVPRLQARSLRDVKTHHKSYKATDWMYFLLSTGEAVLSGRIPDIYFEMYMSLFYACRLLIRPGGLSRAELLVADNHLKKFCEVFYEHVYRNDYNRLPVCRFPLSALLNIVPNIRACGPVWVSGRSPPKD